jgi:hypothetical protein
MEILDYVVIGSGCTGAMAAQTLVESGVHVTLLDAGADESKYSSIIPDKDYLSIRKTEQEQYRYLIGDAGEGIAWGGIKTGEHLTPSRKHILKWVDDLLPIESQTFFPMESLAYGGLGCAWGLGCCQFSDVELQAVGLNKSAMQTAYNTIAKRIGICGAQDDASPYTIGELKDFQTAPVMDRNHSLLYQNYQQKKKSFSKHGFYMGRPALALLTQAQENRKAYAYKDMDFYSDNDESAYRPWITINKLKKENNFQYINGLLFIKFKEQTDHIDIHCLEIETNTPKIFHCKKLILATGVLGSARIVLRSFEEQHKTLPILTNAYSYIPCVQPAMFGKEAEKHKLGFAQLSIFHDENGDNMDVAMGSIYSYQSLMLFRIIKEAPLNFADARIIMRYLMSGILIMGLHHPENKSATKYVELIHDMNAITGDKLKINYVLDDLEKNKISAREKKFKSRLRALGAYAIKSINPGSGSSIHYAGSLPMDTSGNLFTTLPNGKLAGTKNIFIADGSGFNYLPAKSLTWSLMANAHLTALNSLKNE